MTKRQRIIIVVLFMATFAGVTLQTSTSGLREPIYQGKSLTWWVGEYEKLKAPERVGFRREQWPLRRHEEAEEAIWQMTSNAVPWIIEGLRTRDSRIQRMVIILISRQSLINFRWEMAEDRRHAALVALRPIGPAAKRAVPNLIALLQDPDIEVRSYAAEALREIGPDARTAISALNGALNGDLNLAVNSVGALESIGKPAIPSLITALKDQRTIVRARAALAIRNLGTDALPALPFLIEALNDSEYGVRAESIIALGNIGPEASSSVPALIKVLKARDVHPLVIQALGKIGAAAQEAIPDISDALRDPNLSWELSWEVIESLKNMGPSGAAAVGLALTNAVAHSVAVDALFSLKPDPKAAIPVLLEALRNGHQDVAMGMDRFRSEASAIVPTVIALLGDEHPAVRAAAAMALGRIGPAAESAIPVLGVLVDDEDQLVRKHVREALEQIDLAPDGVVDVLLSGAANGTPKGRAYAIQQLGNIGANSEAVLQAVRTSLEDSEPIVRQGAVAALLNPRLQEEKAIPWLIVALKDENESVRKGACDALGDFRPATGEMISALISVLGDKDNVVRCAAARALGKIGPEARVAIPSLVGLVNDREAVKRENMANAAIPREGSWQISFHSAADAQSQAIHTLALIDPRSPDAFLALLAALRDDDSYAEAERSLRKMAPQEPVVIPGLIQALQEKPARMRVRAAYALGKIKRGAETAIPALITALNDWNGEVRMYAARALGRIGPPANPALPSLCGRLEDREKDVRLFAAFAIAKIQLGGNESAPILTEALADQTLIGDLCHRNYAAEALAALGPAARQAVPALLIAVKDPDHEFAQAAGEALAKIDPKASASNSAP